MEVTTHHGGGRSMDRIIGPDDPICFSDGKREKQPGLIRPSTPFHLHFLGFLLSNQGSLGFIVPFPFL